MNIQQISDFKHARIIDAAKQGSTISGIAHQTGIPFATVRRTVYAFDNIGIIKTTKIGQKVFVRIPNPNHPIVNSMIEATKWISAVIWDPDTFVASIFEKHGIDYAFVGTSRIKYIKKESRNMVQIAVTKNDYDKAKKIIHEGFKGMGIRTTEKSNEIIGNAMSIVYAKCFPVDNIGYEEYDTQSVYSNEMVKIKVADENTEKKAMENVSMEDKMFIPNTIYQ